MIKVFAFCCAVFLYLLGLFTSLVDFAHAVVYLAIAGVMFMVCWLTK